MNILPKKRWHVRTKENIARVRRDEAQAAVEEKERQRRALLAEQEARTAALREKVRSRLKVEGSPAEEPDENGLETGKYEHVNLFQDVEEGKIVSNRTNAEYEREEKEEKEKYEKQIGYLTYLGQNTVEATGKISWYNKVPDRFSNTTDGTEVDNKSKSLGDPLSTMKKYVPSSEFHSMKSVTPDTTVIKSEKINSRRREHGKTRKRRKHKEKKQHSFKHKNKCKRRRNYSSDSYDSDASSRDEHPSKRKCKSKRNSKDSSGSSSEYSDSSNSTDGCEETPPKRSSVDMEKLRAERLRREKEEQLRTQALLAKLRGDSPPPTQAEKTNQVPVVKQKYNSQFNPELARQNFQNASL